MDDVRNLLKENIELQLEELKAAKPGSKESVIITGNTAKLTESYLKTVSRQDDIFNNEVDRQKIVAETKKLKLEAERIVEEREKPEPGFVRRNEEAIVKVGGTIIGIGVIVTVQEIGNRLLQGNLLGKLIP